MKPLDYGEGKTREQEARDPATMLALVLVYVVVVIAVVIMVLWLL